jgi:hypothetical protein
MNIKLRDGWTLDDDGHCVWIHLDGDHYLNAYAIVVTDDESVVYFAAYPHGGKKRTELPTLGGKRCNTAEEAHTYLVSAGSESPWEEVC